MANRKQQGEIDRVFKKVEDGVHVFEQIWDKVYSAATTAQKEKYEGDLKKEIKKLQRLRDQIKTWQGDSSIKDKTRLDANRKLIEEKMERFKVCEKETKTKAFSKEGLAQDRTDPKQKAKATVGDWVRDAISRLTEQCEEMEAEIESLNSGKRKKRNNDEHPRVTQNKEHISRHQYHMEMLERVLRAVDNDAVTPEQAEELKDSVDYYIDSNQDPDFYEDDEMYEALNLDAAPTPVTATSTTSVSANAASNTTTSSSTTSSKKASKAAAAASSSPNDDDEGESALLSSNASGANNGVNTQIAGGVSGTSANTTKKTPTSPRMSKSGRGSVSGSGKDGKSGAVNASLLRNASPKNGKGAVSGMSANSNSNAMTSIISSTSNNVSSSVTNHHGNNVSSSISNSATSTTTSSTTATSNETTTIPMSSTTPGHHHSSNNHNHLNTSSSTGHDPNHVVVGAQQFSPRSPRKISNSTTTTSTATIGGTSTTSSTTTTTTNHTNNASTLLSNVVRSSGMKNANASIRAGNGMSNLNASQMKHGRHTLKSSLAPQHHQQHASTSILEPSATATSTSSTATTGEVAATATNATGTNTASTSPTSSPTISAQMANGAVQHHHHHPHPHHHYQQQQQQHHATVVNGMRPSRDSNNSSSSMFPPPEQKKSQQQGLVNQMPASSKLDQTTSGDVSANKTINNSKVIGDDRKGIVTSGGAMSGKPNATGSNVMSKLDIDLAILEGVLQYMPETRTTNMMTTSHGQTQAQVQALSSTHQKQPSPPQQQHPQHQHSHPYSQQPTSSSQAPQPTGPRNPMDVPSSFPVVPASVFDSREVFQHFHPDTLFFIFYYQQGTYQQYLAASELKRQGWRFHKKYLTWFQRHYEPKISTDEYETGTFIYFDYANVVVRGEGSGWCQRIKSEFRFDYRFLEDEL